MPTDVAKVSCCKPIIAVPVGNISCDCDAGTTCLRPGGVPSNDCSGACVHQRGSSPQPEGSEDPARLKDWG
eukprot:s1468_g14.t1